MRKWRWRKGLGLAVLAITVLGPPLAFGVSNLFLLSPMGRDYVAGRIQRTIHLETSVRGGTWSPWNGFTIYGLHIEHPEPLRKAISVPMLTAEKIRIHPEWRALAQRRLVIRGIEIRNPVGAVAIELLSQIPSAPVEPAIVAKPPELAGVDPAPDLPTPSPPSPPAPPSATNAPIEKPATIAPPAVTTPTVWISVTGGSLRIVSAMTKEPLYRISRIDGAIPLGGKKAEAGLVLGGIAFLGNEIPETVSVPLKWENPVLHAGVIEGGVFGIGCKLEAKFGLTPGLPFLIGGIFPKQDGKEIVLSEGIRSKLGSVAGQGRIQGFLLAPGSWQGQGIVQALAVETEYGGLKANFGHGQALVMFQSGALRCLDARLVGEETSILGNAMLLSDGRFAGIARVVASPEALIAVSRFTHPAGTAPQLTPLSTPQRAALDMRIFGSPGNLFFQPNPAAKAFPLQ
jgi:hypothetical protein